MFELFRFLFYIVISIILVIFTFAFLIAITLLLVSYEYMFLGGFTFISSIFLPLIIILNLVSSLRELSSS
ncbi:hypothetical protein CFT13S00388_02435 [Campylobacter fetus subsp. testudinum]|nr:hypothetical protein CFT13S00388_02435 [Campylobacter fetus subsp. testudinum]